MQFARSSLVAFTLASTALGGCPEPPKAVTTTADAATPILPSDAELDAEMEAETEVAAASDVGPETPTYAEDEIDTRTCADDYPKGASSSWRSCPGLGGCVIAGRDCCSPCGAPQRCDVYAVSTMHASSLEQKVCPTPMACPACVSTTNRWLQAFCESGTCVVVDVRTHAISACATDDDCVARTTYCCDDCFGNDPVVAIRKDQVKAYAQQVCGKTKCMQCKSPPPSTHKAICHPVRKHCVIAG
jgi:hypothetical protein